MITELIKTRRKELKMTQAALSKATGVSQGNLSKIERGLIPRFDDAIRILRALNISVKILNRDLTRRKYERKT